MKHAGLITSFGLLRPEYGVAEIALAPSLCRHLRVECEAVCVLVADGAASLLLRLAKVCSLSPVLATKGVIIITREQGSQTHQEA